MINNLIGIMENIDKTTIELTRCKMKASGVYLDGSKIAFVCNYTTSKEDLLKIQLKDKVVYQKYK